MQASARALTKELDECSGRLAEIETKIRTTAELHAEFPSRTTAQQLQKLEVEQEEVQERISKAKAALTTGESLAKEEFFSRLDLEDNNGRAAANNLIKRLELRGYFRRFSKPDHFSCWVKDGEKFLFSVEKNGEAVRVSSFTEDQVLKQVAFNEIKPEQAAWEIFKIENPSEALLEMTDDREEEHLDSPVVSWKTTPP